jgi:hypothetical protein
MSRSTSAAKKKRAALAKKEGRGESLSDDVPLRLESALIPETAVKSLRNRHGVRLGTSEGLCLVKGHDFSRAAND